MDMVLDETQPNVAVRFFICTPKLLVRNSSKLGATGATSINNQCSVVPVPNLDK